MKREFDEVNNIGDAWIADTKGQIREMTRRKNLTMHELSERSGISLETILRVLWEDNIRHTVKTLVELAAAVDIRIARINGVSSKVQPDELRSLSEKQLQTLAEWIRKNQSERKKKSKKKAK